MKTKKFTFRDGFFLFVGMMLGVTVMCLWLFVGIISAISSVPANSINVEVDFNESELVEASFNWMNKTGQLPEREEKTRSCYWKSDEITYFNLSSGGF